MPGLAITDHGTISGVPEFFSIAEKYPDIKPIAGCEFWVGDKGSQRSNHLILLAKNLIGYKNLVKLVTFAHTEGMYYKPRITKEVLVAHHEGLICTSACIGGEIPQAILADDMENALYGAKFYQWLFGDDFYLEVSLHRNSGPIKLASKDDRKVYRKQNRELVRLQKKANEGIFEIARELGVKVIVTNDVHFVNRADGIVHDVINHGEDGIPHGFSVQDLTSFLVDDLPLLVHDLVIIQQILTNTKVVALDLLLGVLNGIGQHLVGQFLVFGDLQGVEHIDHTLGTEQAHQVILQRDIEPGFTGIALSSGTAAQLVVDTSGFMPLGTDDLQTAQRPGLIIQWRSVRYGGFLPC